MCENFLHYLNIDTVFYRGFLPTDFYSFLKVKRKKFVKRGQLGGKGLIRSGGGGVISATNKNNFFF